MFSDKSQGRLVLVNGFKGRPLGLQQSVQSKQDVDSALSPGRSLPGWLSKSGMQLFKAVCNDGQFM